MILIKIKDKTDSAAAEYMTEDFRFYIKKHKPGKGWDVYKLDSYNSYHKRYKFYSTLPSLEEVRRLP